jgi:formylglycine-generating enzyme required for sulfatase activity
MSAARTNKHVSLLSLVIPSIAILAFGGGIAGQLGLFETGLPRSNIEQPETVSIPARAFTYRADGEYYKNGFAVDAPMVDRQIDQPLTIMKFEVTEAEYARCVAAGSCVATEAVHVHGDDRPVTGVSWDDANAYAKWLSAATGEIWVLPTQEQLAFAAGTKFPDDALGVDANADARNPAIRWLADYDRETRRKAARDPLPQPKGHYGENEYGLADFAGNVWEWTTSCQRRIDLAATGDVASAVSTCGVYVTVGQHRSPMSSFVRDPKTGGCSVGAPPANLGFRLIRDDRWYAAILMKLRQRGIVS